MHANSVVVIDPVRDFCVGANLSACIARTLELHANRLFWSNESCVVFVHELPCRGQIECVELPRRFCAAHRIDAKIVRPRSANGPRHNLIVRDAALQQSDSLNECDACIACESIECFERFAQKRHISLVLEICQSNHTTSAV